jgi:GNAT superfamily N-acetyltransferase
MTENAAFKLPDGYLDLPPGKLASVVTYLEMTAPPPARPITELGGLSIERLGPGDEERYRQVYRRIGERWLWVSRLGASAQDIAKVLSKPDIETFVLVKDGQTEGLVEIDFSQPGEAELYYFGITESLIGRGAGRWLMSQTLQLAWSHPINRFWLHTCSFDHPGAVAFYRRTGFRPYKQAIEIVDDPRVKGMLDRNSFPDLPITA